MYVVWQRPQSLGRIRKERSDMQTAKIIAFGFLFLMKFAYADDWTSTDTAWQMSYTALLAMDCAQTRYGASHPEKFEEVNPLLGKHPSKGRINNICIATGFGHFGISYVLPKGARRLWHFGTVSVELFTVANNKMAGVKMEF